MTTAPVAPSIADLAPVTETRVVDECNESRNTPQTICDRVYYCNDWSDKESSSSVSTTVATESHATLKIEAEVNNVSHRAPPLSISSDSNCPAYGLSDSGLAEIKDDNPSIVNDATVGNQRDGGIVEGDKTFIGAAGVNRRSTRRPCPTRRQTLLWEGLANSDEEGLRHQDYSILASVEPASISTTHPHPIPQLRDPAQEDIKTGRKTHQAKHSATDDLVEQRISSHLQTAMNKGISFANYSDEGDGEGHSGTVAGPSMSREVATQTVVSMPEPGSWKTGWFKSDSSVQSVQKPAVKNEPVAIKRKQLSVGSSLRPRRISKATHKRSHSKLTMANRVECPKGCGETFGRAYDAHRHANQTMGCGGGQKSFVCPTCRSNFSRKDALRRHQGFTDDSTRQVPRRCSSLRPSSD